MTIGNRRGKEVYAVGFVTIAEATRRLGISRATLYRWARAGRLTLHKVGPRATRVKEEEVQRLEEGARPVYPRPPSHGGFVAEANRVGVRSLGEPDEDDLMWMEEGLEDLPPYDWGPEGVPPIHPIRHVPWIAPGSPTVTGVFSALRTALAAEEDVAFAYLFGSIAKGRVRRESDVDVAVWLAEGNRRRAVADPEETRLALEGKFERALGREADVVLLNDAPLDLVQNILDIGILFHCSDEAARHAFYVRHAQRYVDMAYARAVFDQAMLRRIREGTFGGGGRHRS
ncbi:type VII toxin-antitoxin system MntA family adenylyltransferase antitoxin [Limnochorda pilosa]|uniref:Helix-turn-helix domain-containing protein n=1 Tax=Limnochorda pilosa TaxID=1555112 RepID=A0A0K2SJY5_LIMPI|nr:nucleotidyltransferase domain-containing protein [Limnochorda pilosa]BAS27410.1 hypothetical protein LIP_1563 [Limnochorda pilosa]